MKIPKHLKIGGHIYRVYYFDRGKKDANERLGSTKPYQNKIWITTDVPQSHQESTLLHEILEIINSLNDLELTENKICVLETNLYQILSENKLLK